jgi:hypothetical protein
VVTELTEDEIRRIRELARAIGRKDMAITAKEICKEMKWTMRQWYIRKPLIAAEGISVVTAGKIDREERDAARGKTNLDTFEVAVDTDLRHDILGGKKHAIRKLRSYGISTIDAESIRRLVILWFEDKTDGREAELLRRALKITGEMWRAMMERRERRWKEAEDRRERAEAERRKEADAERDRELDSLGSGA